MGEETIMESTAVIYCTKGSGGFAFYATSRITITNLSLINCGALHTDARVLKDKMFSTFLFIENSLLSLHYISIQNSSGHGIVAYNCQLEIDYCSIAYSNIDRKSLDTPKCNRLINGSNFLIVYKGNHIIMFKNLTVSNSNFTDGCGKFQYGNVVLLALNSKVVKIYLYSNLIVQNIQNGGDGIVMRTNTSSITLKVMNSTVKGIGKSIIHQTGSKGMLVETFASCANITINGVVFIDNSGGQLFVKFHGGPVVNLVLKNSVILHQNVRTRSHYGVSIFVDENKLDDKIILALQNVTMSLRNAFAVGFQLTIAGTNKVFSGDIYIQDSLFSANRNMKSVMSLHIAVQRPVQIRNCYFFDNSGGSVISVSTINMLLFSNVTFANNSMTAVAVWNGFVQFSGSNEIQNNHGTGIFLQGSSFIKVNGKSELTFLNNTARTVGGAIEVNDMRTFPNDYCSILVSDDSQIIFSGNQAVEGGGDVYGARLVDCLDINNNSVLRQGQPNETSWYFNIPQSHTMQFNNTDTLSSFSSDPIMVCFCESGFPNCSKRMEQ